MTRRTSSWIGSSISRSASLARFVAMPTSYRRGPQWAQATLAGLIMSGSMFDRTAPPALLEGSLLLRPVRAEDRNDRIAAGLDPDFLRSLAGDESRITVRLSEGEANHWYDSQRDGRHWVIEWGGRAIGNAGFSHLDELHRYATYHIGIWAAAARGQGVGTAATRMVVRHSFEVMGLHRLDLRVLETNVRAIRCYERCGFVREGVEAETARVGGRWVNDLRMRILESEYRKFPSRSTKSPE